ncbi:FGGY-family carbohydrate kinase [Microbacterium sp. SORGH_AS_0888]|uniref:xylulokinase n=1 Tax=Microbacterium sp. SORGH_AS_0888 TaxID=3041791 RepID=UPI002782F158|nr:FGGY family carbohydrate kinase [Microbacterium sp. SORGH_AS_0888]MDQ1129482.1 xylulokinase [Microbacterium sp. SORGH_AS_0888]
MYPASPTVIGLDVGSHGVRAVALRRGVVAATARADYEGDPPPARRPLAAYTHAAARALASLPEEVRGQARAVAVTGVRGSVVGFGSDGQPCTPVLPDLDGPSTPAARELYARYGESLADRTGCPAFPLSGLPKLIGMRGRAAQWLGLQDALAWWLTGRFGCSAGAALRLGVLDRSGQCYERGLLGELDIDLATLAPLRPLGSVVGEVLAQRPLPEGIPVVAAPGDGPSAFLAVTEDTSLDSDAPGLVSLGTSTVVSARIADPDQVAMMCTLEVLPGGIRILETGDGTGMASVDWAARLVGVPAESMDEIATHTDAASAAEIRPPAMDAWGTDIRGSLTGIGSDFTRAELAAGVLRAVAEGALRSVARVVDAAPVDALVLTGGGARSARIRAAIDAGAAVPVHARGGQELAAIGAALTARRAVS